MTSISPPVRLLLLFSLLLLTTAGSAQAGLMTTFTVETTSEPGGLTHYGYTLTNLPVSDFPTVDLILGVSTDANLQDITGPSGWTVYYNPGDSTIEWSSPSSATDLAPGNSTTFSFESSLGSGLQDYLITGLTQSPPSVDTNSGRSRSPLAASYPSRLR